MDWHNHSLLQRVECWIRSLKLTGPPWVSHCLLAQPASQGCCEYKMVEERSMDAPLTFLEETWDINVGGGVSKRGFQQRHWPKKRKLNKGCVSVGGTSQESRQETSGHCKALKSWDNNNHKHSFVCLTSTSCFNYSQGYWHTYIPVHICHTFLTFPMTENYI